MFELGLLPVAPSPFAHVVAKEFLSADLYEQLLASFPVCPPSSGPTGFSYFRGDPAYDELIATNEAWSSFFHAIHSEQFVADCLRQFSGIWTAAGCLIDVSRAEYVDYCESRADKERRHLAEPVHAPEKLWVRLDILQGQVGYRRSAHLDHRRRLLTMLVYFCDSAENEMNGGDLVLHRAVTFGGKQALLPEKRLVPQPNEMVAFACTPESLHSVTEIVSQKAPRNFVQITVSSSVDAWPA